jgi:hypothetical protein
VELADEGSLGKTIEAFLVISQMWYESRARILLIVPTPILVQWQNSCENRFSIPYTFNRQPGPQSAERNSIMELYGLIYFIDANEPGKNVHDYLKKTKKTTFPKPDKCELSLMINKGVVLFTAGNSNIILHNKRE